MGKFYSIPKTEDLMTITVERCLEIIAQKNDDDAQKTPVIVGKYKDMDVSVAVGRYGPYVAYNKQFYSLPKGTDIKSLSLDAALQAIEAVEKKKTILTFQENPNIKVLKGKYGAYITDGKDNYKIPKDKNPAQLNCQDCLDIITQNKNDNPVKKKITPKKK
jgi:DNA topoisomerase-1